jgi:hypothetical protein
MIDLKVNGVSLELDPATSIRWVKESSLFTEEAVPAPYSFPFQLPASKRNREILSHQDIIRSTHKCTVYESELYLAGSLFFRGNLSIEKTLYRKQYRVKLIVHRNKFVEKRLDEFDFGGVLNVIDGDDKKFPKHPHQYNNAEYPDEDIFFPYIHHETEGYINFMSTSLSSNGFYCPFVYLQTVLDVVLASAGYNKTGTFFNDSEVAQLLIYNNRYLEYIPSSGPGVPFISDDLNLAHHLPRISFGELLTAFAKYFCLLTDFHKDKLIISDARTILSSFNQIDWTEKTSREYQIEHGSESGHRIQHTFDRDDAWQQIVQYNFGNYIGEWDTKAIIDTIPSPNKWDIAFATREYKLYRYNGSVWDFLSYNYLKSESGDSSLSIQPKASSCIMENHEAIYTKQEHHDGYRPDEYKEFGLRFVLRRGWVHDSNNDSRPLASGTEYNYDLDVIGNYSLYPEGERGTYHVWWKDFIDTISCSKTVTMALDLNINDVMNFIPDRIIHIDGVGYLWKRFDFEFTMNGLNFTKAELVKI